jgi:post-segregation antitoxin (ccd killing protein)
VRFDQGDVPVRTPLYDHNAKRRTVSVTLNTDLVARAAAHGINISRVAEAALIAAFETAEKAAIVEEIRAAVRYTDERAHGYPFPESQAMFMPEDEDAEDLNDDAA